MAALHSLLRMCRVSISQDQDATAAMQGLHKLSPSCSQQVPPAHHMHSSAPSCPPAWDSCQKTTASLQGLHKLSPMFPHDPAVTFNDFKSPGEVLEYDALAETLAAARPDDDSTSEFTCVSPKPLPSAACHLPSAAVTAMPSRQLGELLAAVGCVEEGASWGNVGFSKVTSFCQCVQVSACAESHVRLRGAGARQPFCDRHRRLPGVVRVQAAGRVLHPRRLHAERGAARFCHPLILSIQCTARRVAWRSNAMLCKISTLQRHFFDKICNTEDQRQRLATTKIPASQRATIPEWFKAAAAVCGPHAASAQI